MFSVLLISKIGRGHIEIGGGLRKYGRMDPNQYGTINPKLNCYTKMKKERKITNTEPQNKMQEN